MCQTIAQVMETAATSADYLKYRYCEEAVATRDAILSPYGVMVMRRCGDDLAKGSWVRETLSDPLETLTNTLETELAVAGYVTYWDGGFTIVTPCHDLACLMSPTHGDECEDGGCEPVGPLDCGCERRWDCQTAVDRSPDGDGIRTCDYGHGCNEHLTRWSMYGATYGMGE